MLSRRTLVYWRLDAARPHDRDRRAGRLDSAFQFPQMLEQDSLDPEIKRESLGWSSHFVDYLLLDF